MGLGLGFDPSEMEIADDLGNPIRIWLADKDNPSLIASVDSDGAIKVTGVEQHLDGDSVTGAKGIIALGSDGTNLQFLATDSDGNLQIDVLNIPNIILASQVSPFTTDINISLDGELVDISDRPARDLGKVDIAAFDASLPVGANIIGKTYITDGANDVDILNDAGTYRLQVAAKIAAGGASQNVVITDPTVPAQKAAVDTSGRLLVSTQPVTPVTSTPVSGVADGNHSGAVTTYFVLHATKVTTVQRFICGGEGKKYTKVELYNDPAGTGVGMILLAKGFIPEGGGNFAFDLNEQYTGNGTRRLAIVRTCSNATETFAKWSGFEV